MKLIYIAGSSHSGSTLLDMMLNAHPAIVSLGEAYKLNEKLARKKSDEKFDTKPFQRCSCGAPSLWTCPFWSEVNDRLLRANGRSLADFDMQDYESIDIDTAPNVAVFKEVSAVASADFVVDSSKSPRRLCYFLSIRGLDVFPIHLVRDPKGQICSVLKKQNTFFKSLGHYEIVQEQLRRTLRTLPHTVVRYEDLIREPERTLRCVLEPLGLQPDPRQLRWAEQEKHLVAGNSVRRGKSSELVLDETWKVMLSPLQKLLIELGTVRSRSLSLETGYFPGN
jgi:hypothetical protein